jgi:RNA polymerase sigma-70 factor, ECF subfamily
VSASPDEDELAEAFSQARPRLVRVAYAILGSHSEAEDVVADCWLRLVAAHCAAPVRDVESWAVVAVSRMALDVLRSARVRREQYVGPWLPEPVVGAASGNPALGASAGLGGGSARMAADPADKVTLDDQVSYALLVVLETLTPAERTAFVLHDLFGFAVRRGRGRCRPLPRGGPATGVPCPAACPHPRDAAARGRRRTPPGGIRVRGGGHLR